MIRIPLANIPNQSFSLQIDDNFYNISIKFVINLMTVSITRNSEIIIQNVRAQPNYIVIPYRYLEDGNFAFVTARNEYPNYTRFGVDQFMLFYSAEELEALRGTARS